MKKKSVKNIIDEYRGLRDEGLTDLIRETFEKCPQVPFAELEKLGFQWVEDEHDPSGIHADQGAGPKNTNQEFLAAYFEGHVKWSETVAAVYNTEKNASSPNYPFLRKYFRQGTPALKALLLRGLDKNPTDSSLLHDLSFFHEHHGMLSELIDRYRMACRLENDLMAFTELAMDFYYNTIEDGFEALYELEQVFKDKPGKRAAIAKLISEHKENDNIKDPFHGAPP